MQSLPNSLENWFASRGWQPRSHQLEMLAAADLRIYRR